MNNKTKRHIRYLATKARKAIECAALDETDSTYLGGYCARGSAIVAHLLKEEGIPCSLVYSDWGHVYVECMNYVIDITATQFGDFPKVMIRTRDDVYAYCKKIDEYAVWWQRDEVFTQVSSLKKWQNKHWPIEQIVNYGDLDYL